MERIPKERLLILAALCGGLLIVGLAADNVAWLARLRVVIQRSPHQFPSSLVVPARERSRPGALLSVYTEARYLYDPDYGLLNNPTGRGRAWEHPATVSYFYDGHLRFAANVGLRLHGGTSRTGSPVQSFRLYFRREYGAVQFRPGTLFGGKGDPLTRLVVHNDLRQNWQGGRGGHWWHLVNPLAFDIAREVGALAPETQPASFVLNGDTQGLYVLTEHVRQPFLVSRFGHDQFDRADAALRSELMRAVIERPTFTMNDASSWIDVDSLTRWFVSIVFCGTTDPYQAVMFRDRTQPDARWFWVNWDMDHSFMDFFGDNPAPWLHDTFRDTIRHRALEAWAIRRLIDEDPMYRAYLAGVFLEVLNYRITPAFLEARFRHYREIIDQFGLEGDGYLEVLAEFLDSRPSFIRGLLVRHLDPGPLYRVQLDGPPGVVFRINDHEVAAGFSGWYVHGTEVRVGIEEASRDFSHWTVAGLHVPFPEVWRRVGSDLVITAEFHPGT